MLAKKLTAKLPTKSPSVPKQEHPVKIRTPLDFIMNLFKGVFMGVADVVPGVSGGTIALVMGIYDQLITTITRVDMKLLTLLRQRQFSNAAHHLNLLFILSLGPGILTGILFMSLLATSLLDGETSSQFTFAIFFGMITASAYLVLGMIEAKCTKSKIVAFTLIILGLVAALAINQLQAGEITKATPTPSRLFIFISAAIAISAMILPGISGSMILMILGIYHHIVKLPKNLFEANERAPAIIELGIFACGALVGLILFSRVLKWLLTHYRHQLLATLTGVMLGALPVLFNAAFEKKGWADTSKIGRIELVGAVMLAAIIMMIITRKAEAIAERPSAKSPQ